MSSCRRLKEYTSARATQDAAPKGKARDVHVAGSRVEQTADSHTALDKSELDFFVVATSDRIASSKQKMVCMYPHHARVIGLSSGLIIAQNVHM